MFFIIVILVVCVCYYLWKKMHFFSSHGVKTLRPLPLLGNLADVTFQREYIDVTVQNGYKAFEEERFFGMYQYLVPTVVIRDLNLVKQIMVRDFNVFFDRGLHIGMDCDSLFGRNLIMLKGSRWRSMRTILSPAFSIARRRGMTSLMQKQAKSVTDHLSKSTAMGNLIDVNDISLAYVHDVIISCAFGLEVDSLKDPNNDIFQLSKTAILEDSTQLLKFFCYENMKSILKIFDIKVIKTRHAEQFSQLFKSVLNARRENVVNRADIIQLLIDAKVKTQEGTNGNKRDQITDDDLVAQAVLFFSGGFDPTASLINYFLTEMAANPDIQERLQAELDNMNAEGNLYEQIQGLEYLDMCISEVLRLWPLVGVGTRRSSETYDFGPTQEGNKHHFIGPVGIHVWVPIYAIHHDEKYWPNPEMFDPERFSPENKSNIVPFSYLPFGSGPRHCLGNSFADLAAKVFLAEFLKKYSTRSSNASRVLCPRGFVLRPKDGFNIIIEPRELCNV